MSTRAWAAMRRWAAVLAGAACVQGALAQGTPVGNAYTQTRSTSFTYYGAADGALQGMLKSETIEPGSAQYCLTTTYAYDSYGNKSVATSAPNCTGATHPNQRSVTTDYLAMQVTVGTTTVNVPAGTLPNKVTNALGQSETALLDPRFGTTVRQTGPNNLSTNWNLDDFGRKVKELRPDLTATLVYYCYLDVPGKVSDLSSNSPGCHNGTSPVSTADMPAPQTSPVAEAPADAVMYVHSYTVNTSGVRNSSFTRQYSDAAGRVIRTVTQAFDGGFQTVTGLIVQDVDYNAFGAKTVTTQPYFLNTGSTRTTGSNDYGMTLTSYDVLGRPVAIYNADVTTGGTQTPENAGGSIPAGMILFGARGSRQAAVTTIDYNLLETTTSNDANQTRKEEKNIIGQVIRVTDALGAKIAFQYDAFANLVVTKDALQNRQNVAYDQRGRKVRMDDPDAGIWTFDYNAFGELVWQRSPNQLQLGQSATTMVYDVLGRMTSRTEPDMVSNWYYDKRADGTTCMAGPARNSIVGFGKLCEANTSTQVNHKYAYDQYGRLVNTRTTIASGPSFIGGVTYDGANGRIASQTYPTGLRVQLSYTARGTLNAVALATGTSPGSAVSIPAGTNLWSARIYDARGQAEETLYGNGIANKSTFDPSTGRLTRLTAGAADTTNTNVLNQRYAWDSLGLLVQRDDANGDGNTGAVSDSFAYDAIGRLQNYAVSAPAIPGLVRTVQLQYNALGMTLYKSDVGVYAYGAAATPGVKPHALASMVNTSGVMTSYQYDANGNLKSATGGAYRSVSYTSFNLPDGQLNGGVQGAPGGAQYAWVYDENHQRTKEVRTGGGFTRTTWYQHPDNRGGLGFECDSITTADCSGADTTNRHFINAGGAAIGVLITTGPVPTYLLANQVSQTLKSPSLVMAKAEFWHKDHLGSLITTTNMNGAVVARFAYDPFGKRRMTNGTYDAFGTLVVDWVNGSNPGPDRGYTGHEHLDDVGIIHMNGRLFDPMLGRFMQADPMLQNPLNLQNYDRYGYCYNSPMVCTDPSGQVFGIDDFFIAVAIIWGSEKVGIIDLRTARMLTGIAVGALLGGANGLLATQGGVTNAMVNAAISGFASGVVASGSVKGGLQGMFSGALFAGVGNLIEGGNFFTGGGTVTDFSAVGGKVGAVALHGVVGCVTSVAGGGKCGQGFLSAAFSEAATVNNLQFPGEYGVISSAIIGGTASVLGGGKFSNGALTAAFGYVFNCLNHPGVCTKADQADIRKAAGACGNDMACINKLANYARESGIPLPPDIGQVLSDFLSMTVGNAVIMAGPGLFAAVDKVGEWVGYIAVDGSGVIRYVGITSRDAAVRWAEHAAADPAKAALNFQLAEGAVFVTKLEARVWEQIQINANGLMKNGGTLLNKINSIAQKYWEKHGIAP